MANKIQPWQKIRLELLKDNWKDIYSDSENWQLIKDGIRINLSTKKPEYFIIKEFILGKYSMAVKSVKLSPDLLNIELPKVISEINKVQYVP